MSAGTEMLHHIAAKTGPFAHKKLIDAAEKLLRASDSSILEKLAAGDLVSIAALNQAFEPLGVPRPGVLVLHPVQATATSKLTGLLDKGEILLKPFSPTSNYDPVVAVFNGWSDINRFAEEDPRCSPEFHIRVLELSLRLLAWLFISLKSEQNYSGRFTKMCLSIAIQMPPVMAAVADTRALFHGSTEGGLAIAMQLYRLLAAVIFIPPGAKPEVREMLWRDHPELLLKCTVDATFATVDSLLTKYPSASSMKREQLEEDAFFRVSCIGLCILNELVDVTVRPPNPTLCMERGETTVIEHPGIVAILSAAVPHCGSDATVASELPLLAKRIFGEADVNGGTALNFDWAAFEYIYNQLICGSGGRPHDAITYKLAGTQAMTIFVNALVSKKITPEADMMMLSNIYFFMQTEYGAPHDKAVSSALRSGLLEGLARTLSMTRQRDCPASQQIISHCDAIMKMVAWSIPQDKTRRLVPMLLPEWEAALTTISTSRRDLAGIRTRLVSIIKKGKTVKHSSVTADRRTAAAAGCGGGGGNRSSIPLTPVTNSIDQTSCNLCAKTGVTLLTCSRCKVAKYCSAECQKRDWKVGKGHVDWSLRPGQTYLPRRTYTAHKSQCKIILQEKDSVDAYIRANGGASSDDSCGAAAAAAAAAARANSSADDAARANSSADDAARANSSADDARATGNAGSGATRAKKRDCTFENDAKSVPGICKSCNQHSQHVLFCQGCKRALYCSRKCQKHDWKRGNPPHKVDCAIKQRAAALMYAGLTAKEQKIMRRNDKALSENSNAVLRERMPAVAQIALLKRLDNRIRDCVLIIDLCYDDITTHLELVDDVLAGRVEDRLGAGSLQQESVAMVIERNRQPESPFFTTFCIGPGIGKGGEHKVHVLTKSIGVGWFESELTLSKVLMNGALISSLSDARKQEWIAALARGDPVGK